MPSARSARPEIVQNWFVHSNQLGSRLRSNPSGLCGRRAELTFGDRSGDPPRSGALHGPRPRGARRVWGEGLGGPVAFLR